MTSANPISGPLIRIEQEMLSCPDPEKENRKMIILHHGTTTIEISVEAITELVTALHRHA